MADRGLRISGPADLHKICDVSRESLAALEAYVDLLLRWQSRINLIARGSGDDIWQRHIADCLQVVPLIPDQARTIIDFGAGAGLPGLVVAAAAKSRPDWSVHLIESHGKKAAFLSHAIQIMDVNATVHAMRGEKFDSQTLQNSIDVVLARAVAPLPKLLELSHKFLQRPNTIGLFHKGQDVDKELTESSKCWNMRLERIPSLTDPSGSILKISEVSRVG